MLLPGSGKAVPVTLQLSYWAVTGGGSGIRPASICRQSRVSVMVTSPFMSQSPQTVGLQPATSQESVTSAPRSCTGSQQNVSRPVTCASMTMDSCVAPFCTSMVNW